MIAWLFSGVVGHHHSRRVVQLIATAVLALVLVRSQCQQECHGAAPPHPPAPMYSFEATVEDRGGRHAVSILYSSPARWRVEASGVFKEATIVSVCDGGTAWRYLFKPKTGEISDIVRWEFSRIPLRHREMAREVALLEALGGLFALGHPERMPWRPQAILAVSPPPIKHLRDEVVKKTRVSVFRIGPPDQAHFVAWVDRDTGFIVKQQSLSGEGTTMAVWSVKGKRLAGPTAARLFTLNPDKGAAIENKTNDLAEFIRRSSKK